MARTTTKKPTAATQAPTGLVAPLDRARRGTDLAVGPASRDDATRVQRVRGAVARLYAAGEFSNEEYEAAELFRRDVEFGLHGASAPYLDRPVVSSRVAAEVDKSCYQTARLNSLGRYRRACAVLGPDGRALLTLFAVEGMSIASAAEALRASRLGRTYGGEVLPAAKAAAHEGEDDLPVRRASLKRRLLAALATLAAHYDDERKRMRALRAARNPTGTASLTVRHMAA